MDFTEVFTAPPAAAAATVQPQQQQQLSSSSSQSASKLPLPDFVRGVREPAFLSDVEYESGRSSISSRQSTANRSDGKEKTEEKIVKTEEAQIKPQNSDSKPRGRDTGKEGGASSSGDDQSNASNSSNKKEFAVVFKKPGKFSFKAKPTTGTNATSSKPSSNKQVSAAGARSKQSRGSNNKGGSRSKQRHLVLPSTSPLNASRSGPKGVFDLSLNESIPVPSSFSYAQFRQHQLKDGGGASSSSASSTSAAAGDGVRVNAAEAAQDHGATGGKLCEFSRCFQLAKCKNGKSPI